MNCSDRSSLTLNSYDNLTILAYHPTTNTTTRNTPSFLFRVPRFPLNEYGSPEYTTSVTSSVKYNCYDTRLLASVYSLKWMCAVLPG